MPCRGQGVPRGEASVHRTSLHHEGKETRGESQVPTIPVLCGLQVYTPPGVLSFLICQGLSQGRGTWSPGNLEVAAAPGCLISVTNLLPRAGS